MEKSISKNQGKACNIEYQENQGKVCDINIRENLGKSGKSL